MGRAWDVKPCAHRWALTMSSQLCHTTTGKPKAWIHKEQHALCPVSSHLYYIDFNGEGDIYFHIMCSAFIFFMILRYHLFPFTIQKDMWKNNLWTLYIFLFHWKYNSTANVSASVTLSHATCRLNTSHKGKTALSADTTSRTGTKRTVHFSKLPTPLEINCVCARQANRKKH